MSIGKALGRLISALWAGVDGLRKILHLILLLLVFAVVLAAIGSSGPSLPSLPASAALVIAPSGAMVEQLEGSPLDRAFAELSDDTTAQTLLRDVVDGLRYAKQDGSIEVVVLELGGLGGAGMSKLVRAAEAITDFRESGKPVIAMANFYSQGAYFLAAHADEVYMHPDGMFLPTGFDMYQNYFKNAIDSLKVDWNIFRVGTHKSAVEPFERNDMSPLDRESRTRLVSQLWSYYQEKVDTARQLEQGALADFADGFQQHLDNNNGSPALAAEALGFVDELRNRNEMRDAVLEFAAPDTEGELGYTAISLDEYLDRKRAFEETAEQAENIAVIVAAGEILDGTQPSGSIGGESTASLLRRARDDSSVVAVVLRVDSPGGSSFASEQIRNEVEALRASGKPVVASMSSLAASGGYWISMAADRIYARESTITGSIGIFGMFPTFQRSLGSLGISSDGVGTTRWAGQLRPDRAMSEDTRDVFQSIVNNGYDDFISKVAMHRELDKSAVDGVAQGQVWTGSDALQFGLIDAIGDLEDALLAAAELVEADPDELGIKYIEETLTPSEQFVVDLLSKARHVGVDVSLLHKKQSPLNRLAGLLDQSLAPLLRLNDPKGVYAHCFCVVGGGN